MQSNVAIEDAFRPDEWIVLVIRAAERESWSIPDGDELEINRRVLGPSHQGRRPASDAFHLEPNAGLRDLKLSVIGSAQANRHRVWQRDVVSWSEHRLHAERIKDALGADALSTAVARLDDVQPIGEAEIRP